MIRGALVATALLVASLAQAATCPTGCLPLSSNPSFIDADTGLRIPVACVCDWDEEANANFQTLIDRACLNNRCVLSGSVLELTGGTCDEGTTTCVWSKTDADGHGEWQAASGGSGMSLLNAGGVVSGGPFTAIDVYPPLVASDSGGGVVRIEADLSTIDPNQPLCQAVPFLSSTDDGHMIAAFRVAVQTQAIGCRCSGGAMTTAPQIQFHDSSANGNVGSAITCGTGTSITFSDVSADADGALVAGEMLTWDVSNTPNPDGGRECFICATFAAS